LTQFLKIKWDAFCLTYDPICWLGFIFLFFLLVFKTNKFTLTTPRFLKNILKYFLINSISNYEILTITTISISLLIFDSISVTIEDDILDSAALIVLIFCITVIIFVFFSLGISFLYTFTLATTTTTLKKTTITDLINIMLCFLRIILCWTRYIFYDIQLESIDMALQYTDEVTIWSSKNINILNKNILFIILETHLDMIFILIQLMLSLFKLLIASYLVFLISDLFIIRPLSYSYSIWYSILKK